MRKGDSNAIFTACRPKISPSAKFKMLPSQLNLGGVRASASVRRRIAIGSDNNPNDTM